ncbi:MAG: hypothetical protein GY822_30690 [Deltaproteobacteria bacterium]|nr:hypothetical protein [Deltaproteobacteria bacterium]
MKAVAERKVVDMISSSHNVLGVSPKILNTITGVPHSASAATESAEETGDIDLVFREPSGESPSLLQLVSQKDMHFVKTPLTDAHFASRDEDGDRVLYIRLNTPINQRSVGVLENAAEEVSEALKEAEQVRRPYQRVVVVGADRLLTEPDAEGSAEGIEELALVLQLLCARSVPTTWRTRAGLTGPVPQALADAFDQGGQYLQIEVGLPSLDQQMCRALEGLKAAHPEQRLRLASAASARGVLTAALVDPLVPMLTDQASNLSQLFEACTQAGMHKVKVRYLVMTRERAKRLANTLSSMHRALIRGVFAEEPWRTANPSGRGPQEAHKLLPENLRRHGHERVALEAQRAGLLLEVLDPVERDAPPVRKGTGRSSQARPHSQRPQLDFFTKSA